MVIKGNLWSLSEFCNYWKEFMLFYQNNRIIYVYIPFTSFLFQTSHKSWWTATKLLTNVFVQIKMEIMHFNVQLMFNYTLWTSITNPLTLPKWSYKRVTQQKKIYFYYLSAVLLQLRFKHKHTCTYHFMRLFDAKKKFGM